MRCSIGAVAFLAILLVVTLAIHATNEHYSNAASFWDLGMGARPYAMGEAFVAVADDSSALSYNPAGLAGQQGSLFSSTGESRPNTAAFGHFTAQLNTIAASIHYFDFGTVMETDEFGNAFGSFSYRSVGVIAGLGAKGTKLPYLRKTSLADAFAVGVNVKLASINTLDPGDGFGAVMSLGLLIREDKPSFGFPFLSSFSFGILVENLLDIPIKYESGHQEPWVKKAAVGASVTFRDFLVAAFDATSLGSSHFGIEWAPISRIAIRVGVKRDGVWMPSLGIGVKLNRSAIDLALVSHPYLADQYRATFTASW